MPNISLPFQATLSNLEYLPNVLDELGHVEGRFSKTTYLSEAEVARLVSEWRALRYFHLAWCRQASVMGWTASDALMTNAESADEVAKVAFERMMSIAGVLQKSCKNVVN